MREGQFDAVFSPSYVRADVSPLHFSTQLKRNERQHGSDAAESVGFQHSQHRDPSPSAGGGPDDPAARPAAAAAQPAVQQYGQPAVAVYVILHDDPP